MHTQESTLHYTLVRLTYFFCRADRTSLLSIASIALLTLGLSRPATTRMNAQCANQKLTYPIGEACTSRYHQIRVGRVNAVPQYQLLHDQA